MWKEEEDGSGRVSDEWRREASEAGASTLATGRPLCLIMLTDAARGAGGFVAVREVTEIVADRLPGVQPERSDWQPARSNQPLATSCRMLRVICRWAIASC
jgi:hypothetical protein